MRGVTHSLIGLGIGFGYALATENPTLPAFVLVAGIGALAPDIDHPNSLISRRLRPLRLLFFKLGHRGFTHSLIASIGLLALYLLTRHDLALSFFLGLVSHILADMLTHSGVRLLYPSKRHFHILPKPLRLTTGGMMESLITLGIFVAFVGAIQNLI